MPTRIMVSNGHRSEYRPRPASPRQIAFMERLLVEREIAATDGERLSKKIARHKDEKDSFQIMNPRDIIDWLLRRPLLPGKVKDHFKAFPEGPRSGQPVVNRSEPAPLGIYRHSDGKVYVVRKSRGSDRRYAVVMVPDPPRIAENGTKVDHDFARAPGMVYRLQDGERVTDPNEIRDIAIKTGQCAQCGHAIWAAKSVERMYGPRCAKIIFSK